MKKATVYIVILAVVCTGLGAVLGATIAKWHITKNLPYIIRRECLRHPEAMRHFGRKAMDVHKERMPNKGFQRICQELNLTDTQREKVEAILETGKEGIKQARDEFKTEVLQIQENNHAQILEVLGPEQQEKFKQLTEKMKERHTGIKDRGYRREIMR